MAKTKYNEFGEPKGYHGLDSGVEVEFQHRKRWEITNHGFPVGQMAMLYGKNDRKYYIMNSTYSDGSYKHNLGTFRKSQTAIIALKKYILQATGGKVYDLKLEWNPYLG